MPRKQQLNLRIDELTRAAIERIAADYNMSKTQVIMRAVMLLEQELERGDLSETGLRNTTDTTTEGK